MSWFNVLKGAYPSLQQIDKTLDVASGVTGIVRGSLIYQDGTSFRLATAAQATSVTSYIYIALQAQTQDVAGMAGSIGQGIAGGVARVTGLAIGMPFEFETDQFVVAAYTVGQLLSVANGGLLTAHSSAQNCLAQVTKTVTSRWVNNAIAVTGYRTGANVNVLTARTLWVPRLVTA